jgi:ATP-dependent Clp protease ATP-binding subunit ClpB
MVEEPDTESAISFCGIKENTKHIIKSKSMQYYSAVELSQRYITNRFPDKAIDLMDEAASKLRMEINSKPEELVLDRKIMQLEIEIEALREKRRTNQNLGMDLPI